LARDLFLSTAANASAVQRNENVKNHFDEVLRTVYPADRADRGRDRAGFWAKSANQTANNALFSGDF